MSFAPQAHYEPHAAPENAEALRAGEDIRIARQQREKCKNVDTIIKKYGSVTSKSKHG